jgi:hypothetical protein
MSAAETFSDDAAEQARVMLLIAADPAGTRARFDELVAATAQHNERAALADRSADAADEKPARADQALAEVVDLQRRVESQNQSLRGRELAVAASEHAHHDAVAALADRETELAKRETRLAAMVRATRQYLDGLEVHA